MTEESRLQQPFHRAQLGGECPVTQPSPSGAVKPRVCKSFMQHLPHKRSKVRERDLPFVTRNTASVHRAGSCTRARPEFHSNTNLDVYCPFFLFYDLVVYAAYELKYSIKAEVKSL